MDVLPGPDGQPGTRTDLPIRALVEAVRRSPIKFRMREEQDASDARYRRLLDNALIPSSLVGPDGRRSG